MDTDLHLQAIQQQRDADAARLVRARDAAEPTARPFGAPARRRSLPALFDVLRIRRAPESPRLTTDG